VAVTHENVQALFVTPQPAAMYLLEAPRDHTIEQANDVFVVDAVFDLHLSSIYGYRRDTRASSHYLRPLSSSLLFARWAAPYNQRDPPAYSLSTGLLGKGTADPFVSAIITWYLALVRGIINLSAYTITKFVRSQHNLSHYNESNPLLAENIVNTTDTTRPEPEYLRSPEDLVRYLQAWNIPVAQEPDVQDLAEVLMLRHRLRALFEAHDIAVAVRILNELLEGIQVRPHVGLTADENINLELEVEEALPLARRLAAKAALGLSAAF
jgi:hypothetical protein